MRSEKKSERLEVRLGHSEKREFVDACESQGDTPSLALRRFIAGFTRRADGEIIGSLWRGAVRRWFSPFLLSILGVSLVVGILFFMNYGRSGTFDKARYFELRDVNRNAGLSPVEMGLPINPDGTVHGIFRVLDIDGSGELSESEFIARGRMAYANGPKGTRQSSGAFRLIEWTIAEDHIRSSLFSFSDDVHMRVVDRLVIWHPDGSNTVMEGPIDIVRGLGAHFQ